MYAYHLAAFVPMAELPLANIVFERLGWGPNSLTVPVTTRVTNTPTHYLLSAPLTEEDYGYIQGVVDRDERPKGVTPNEALAFKKLIYHVEPYGQRMPIDHVREVMATNNLRFVEATA